MREPWARGLARKFDDFFQPSRRSGLENGAISEIFLRNKKKVVGHYTTPIKETKILLVSCEFDRSCWFNLMVDSHLNWLLETRQPARTFDRLFSINAINSSSETPSLGAVVETGLKDTWYVVVLYWWLGIELNVVTSVVTAGFTASRSGDAIIRSEAFGGLQSAGMKERWEFDVGGKKRFWYNFVGNTTVHYSPMQKASR